MADQILVKTVNGWDCVRGSHQRAVALIGFIHTGRSTFAELVRRHQHGKIDDRLQFEKDKYVLENVISSKSIKVQTTSPVLYESNSPQGLALLDVPCYVLPPELKKWTNFDQKITLALMLQNCQTLGFLLFVEEKNTRTNLTAWKKTFYGWLDAFRQFPESLVNSVGWLITKCPGDINEDSVAKRLRNLQGAMKTDRPADSALIDRIFDAIIANNRFFIFHKVKENNAEAEGEEIRNIFTALGTLPSYPAASDNTHERMACTPEEQALLKQIVERADESLTKAASLLHELLNSLSSLSPELCVQAKKSFYSDADPALEGLEVSSFVKGCLRKDWQLQIWEVIGAFKLTAKAVEEFSRTGQGFPGVVQSLMRFPFFIQEPNDQREWQLIWQAVGLIPLLPTQTPFPQAAAKLGEVFLTDRGDFYNSLASVAPTHDNEQFYEAVIGLLEEDKQLSAVGQKLLQSCQDSVVKFRSPKKLIEKMVEELSGGEPNRQWEATCRIAAACEKQGDFRSAAALYRLARCPGESFRCYEKAPPRDTQEGIALVRFLTHCLLFAEARKKCYELAAQIGGSRRAFGEELAVVGAKEEEWSQGGRKGSPLLEEVVLSSSQREQVRVLAFGILAQLKDS